jgi:hypothetical protein
MEGTRDTLKHKKVKETSNEPFMSIDDYFIPFLPDGGANVRSIGGCNLRPWRVESTSKLLVL